MSTPMASSPPVALAAAPTLPVASTAPDDEAAALRASERERSRLREVHAVLLMNAASCLLVLCYLGLTPDGPNRVRITAVALATLGYLAAIRLAGPRRTVRLHRGLGALVSFVISVLVVTAFVVLDGGSTSPLNATYLLPLALAISSAPAAAGLICGLVITGHLTAAVLAGPPAPEYVLIWVSQFALLSLAAAWVGRIRVAHRQRLRELAAELEELATRDPLTRTLNRRGFDALLSAAGRRYEPHAPSALLVVDLDHFKRINDFHGHLVGDEVLVAAATAIDTSVRDGDLVARLGGEEFAVLLRGADPATARRVAERIRVAVSTCSTAVPVTASVGIASATHAQVESELDGLIARADTAMYAAKAAGRDRVSESAVLAVGRSGVSDDIP